jgi:hypothetical protein
LPIGGPSKGKTACPSPARAPGFGHPASGFPYRRSIELLHIQEFADLFIVTETVNPVPARFRPIPLDLLHRLVL